jgi:hypothetical protein
VNYRDVGEMNLEFGTAGERKGVNPKHVVRNFFLFKVVILPADESKQFNIIELIVNLT